MFVSRVLTRISRSSLNHCRGFVSTRQELPQLFSNNFHSLRSSSKSTNECVAFQGTGLHEFARNTNAYQRFWYSSSVSPEPTEKETNQSGDGHETTLENNNASNKAEGKTNEDGTAAEQTEKTGFCSEQKLSTSQSVKKRRRGTKRTAFSDSDTEDDLSVNDLVMLVAEKEELLRMKHKEIEKMQDKILRSYAEMENVIERTRREAENSKKFAIQSFAKGLLDVADNLGRASSVVKDSFSKIDSSQDAGGATPLLKTLLEGVEMTEKQLAEVLKKFGVEKFDPLNEQFDPNRHHALFQIPDGSKPAGTVAAVLKPGYMMYDRIIRPAEVGVTEASNGETEQNSEA